MPPQSAPLGDQPESVYRAVTRHSAIAAILTTSACLALGLIALYSAGVGLVDPKLHRALGFALSLVVAIAVSRRRVAEQKPPPRLPAAKLLID